MTSTLTAAQHAAEVQNGERFEFGKNWQRFLSMLSDERISLAERSLQKFLGAERLDGKTFLDIGSGSGLFSLAARRLGARVHSFDYDTHSVACTSELRRRYFPADRDWTVEQGSVLDRGFLARLGEFDVVYSWGVLHHTGQMWQALDNVKPLVRMGGQLFIAIYNDLGVVTDRWREIKRRYNALPPALRLPFALAIIAASESRILLGHLRRADLGGYVRTWTDYQRLSTRGMSRWHDWLDWIGGYPYECAGIDAIVDFFDKDGFRVAAVEDRSSGYGCNEFVFRREAPLGSPVDGRLRESRSFLRRFGRRLGPPSRTESGHVAALPDGVSGTDLLLFRDGEFIGPATPGREPGTIVVPTEGTAARAADAVYQVVPGHVRDVPAPFRKRRGRMWSAQVPDLVHLGDAAPDRNGRSPVFVFEDGRQLAFPYSAHRDIARAGAGRFSHWDERLFFSTSDNSNPNRNGRAYRLIYPAETA